MNTKKFVSKPKAFTLIGYILIIFGAAYILTAIGETDFTAVREAVTGGLITIIISIGLLYLGSRKRTIRVSDDGVEYISGSLLYSAKWDELEMISAEGEKNKSAITVYFVKNEENIFYMSTAFFNYSLLKNAFIEIAGRLKANNPGAEISDEAGWLTTPGIAPVTYPNTP